MSHPLDQLVIDLEVLLATLKQANLLFDADAWSQLRQVNDQLKAQAKVKPELHAIFAATEAFFSHARSKAAPVEESTSSDKPSA